MDDNEEARVGVVNLVGENIHPELAGRGRGAGEQGASYCVAGKGVEEDVAHGFDARRYSRPELERLDGHFHRDVKGERAHVCG